MLPHEDFLDSNKPSFCVMIS